MNRARSQKAKDLRKQHLLEAALDEFFERGYTAARMDDIAKRAGFSKGTLYLYFDSKEALFTSLVSAVALPNLQRIETRVPGHTDFFTSLRDFLNLASAIVSKSRLPKLMKILISDAQHFPEIIKLYHDKFVTRVLGVLTSLLEAAHRRGEIQLDDPDLTARLIVAPVMFSALWQVVFAEHAQQAVNSDHLFQHHFALLERALKP